MKVLRNHFFEEVQAVSTDAELYRSTSDLLSQAMRGRMATIFMYGMTGSGKTYSMNALHRELPVDIFAHIDAARGSTTSTRAKVRFHAYELLGKRCFDLADGKSEAETTNKTEVFLRVGGDGMTNISGITEHEVTSSDALIERLCAAVARRETSATGTSAKP